MGEDIFLSIIIPVYNSEKYLEYCIDSVLGQTYKKFELILVNDGSIDNSGIICKKYVEKDIRVKYICKENEGACYARRDGVLAAQGDYVGFIDSDDWIEPNMYEDLVNSAKEKKADIVTSGFIYDEKKEYVTDFVQAGIYEKEELKDLCKRMIFDEKANTGGVLVSVCNKIYKKELIIPYLKALNGNIRLWEDICYVYPPFVDARTVVVTHKCFYHYRQNMESTTHRFDVEELDKTLYSLKKAWENYKKFSEEIQMGFYKKYTQIVYRYLWKSCIDKTYGDKEHALNDFWKVENDVDTKYIISKVITGGNITECTEEKFMRLLLDGKYEDAYMYCKKENFILKLNEFLYYKVFRRLFNQKTIDFVKKRILKNANE